jgi:hypothetical protein
VTVGLNLAAEYSKDVTNKKWDEVRKNYPGAGINVRIDYNAYGMQGPYINPASW